MRGGELRVLLLYHLGFFLMQLSPSAVLAGVPGLPVQEDMGLSLVWEQTHMLWNK